MQRADDAGALHLLDQARGAVVPDAQTPLHAGNGSAARFGDDLAAVSRYLDQLLALREVIQRVLIPEETDAARTEGSENVRLFLSRSQEFIRVLETVRTCYGVRGVVTENRIAVRDWWYTLESYPTLSQEILAAVRQQMAKIPVQLADEHLENVETVLFAEGFRRLPEALQHDVVCILPVLLLDGEAFDNFAWMLTENAFATGGDWVSHSDLMNQVDVLRCFILQGTEFLTQIAHMLSTLDRQAQQPFWDLLNLEALNRAAALSVGVDTHRLKTVMGALRRSNVTRAKHVSYPQSVRSKTA